MRAGGNAGSEVFMYLIASSIMGENNLSPRTLYISQELSYAALFLHMTGAIGTLSI